MLIPKYKGQQEVWVKVLPSWGVQKQYRSKRRPFQAKVIYADTEAISVMIDGWWIFFNHYGQQYGEYPSLASHPEFELSESPRQ